MPRRLIKRHLPPPEHFKDHKHLQHLGERLADPNLWHLNRRSAAGAVGIGLFVAFLPLPGQTVVASIAAIWARVNLPICFLMTWVTNPFTMAPMFLLAYGVGSWLLGTPIHPVEFEATWEWAQTEFLLIWKPFLLGSFVVGLVAGVSGGLLTLGLWRLDVGRRWKNRKKRRIAHQAGR